MKVLNDVSCHGTSESDVSPNLTGKNLGSSKRVQSSFHETCPNLEMMYFHCIIHQASLNITRVMKSRRMRWAGQEARMGNEKCIQDFDQNTQDHSEDIGVDGMIILKCVLRKQGGRVWSG
jgi:hypothetical protein